jgi:hypothetical protein
LGRAEYIRKAFFHFPYGLLIAVHGNGLVMAQGPYVVKAVEMVRVGVGEQYGVESGDARGQGLEAEFGACVNENPLSGSAFNIQG